MILKSFSLDTRIGFKMNKFRLFLVCALCFTSGLTSSFYIARVSPELVVPDVMYALDEALVEVQKGCPMLLEYAQMLEQENAKLNRTMNTLILKKD